MRKSVAPSSDQCRQAEQFVPASGSPGPFEQFFQCWQIVEPLKSRDCSGIRGTEGIVAEQRQQFLRFGYRALAAPLFQNRLIR